VELTPRQESVLAVIIEYHRRYGYFPTVREIGGALGLAGPAGIHRILRILEAKGHILSTPGKKRSWRLAAGDPDRGLPVKGRIAAGEPLDVWESPDERIPLDPTFYGHEDCFALRVKGDSMIGRHIRDGDLAVIRPQTDVENGEIAAVIVAGVLPEAALKIIRKNPKSISLHSANPAYPPLRFSGTAAANIRIIGRYVGLIRIARQP